MKKLLLLILFAATILASCSSPASEFSFMSSWEARDLIEGGADVIVVDVRSEAEFLNGHIEGSILLPVNEIADYAESVLLDRNAVILVICQSGNRSRTASQALADLGFTNVYDIGGIMAWPGEILRCYGMAGRSCELTSN